MVKKRASLVRNQKKYASSRVKPKTKTNLALKAKNPISPNYQTFYIVLDNHFIIGYVGFFKNGKFNYVIKNPIYDSYEKNVLDLIHSTIEKTLGIKASVNPKLYNHRKLQKG